MSIIRVKHQRDYVVIHKSALEDTALSFKAKGLWAYCMSRPDDWTFHVSHLVTVSQNNRDSIFSALRELEKCGYLTRIQKKKKDGKFETFEYQIHELKKCLPQTENPYTEKPLTENPDTEKPTLLSIDSNQVKKDKNIPPPKEPQISHGEYVKLKSSEYLRLCEEHSKEVIDDYIERINDYCLAKGRSPYKGYAATIRNWIRNSFNSTSAKPQNRAVDAQKYAKRIESMHPYHPQIQIDSKGILFISGGQAPDTYIKFEDAGFRDQVDLHLRKRNLSLPQDIP